MGGGRRGRREEEGEDDGGGGREGRRRRRWNEGVAAVGRRTYYSYLFGYVSRLIDW